MSGVRWCKINSHRRLQSISGVKKKDESAPDRLLVERCPRTKEALQEQQPSAYLEAR